MEPESITDQNWDIAVIGAGAAGLAAGIFAAETAQAGGQALRIALLDSAKKIGAKILVSGGGRCNVTHDEIHPEDFNGSHNIVRNVLAAFDEKAAARWFQSLGAPLKREESGKLFPVSDSARTVLEVLLRRCAKLEVTILPRHRVYTITPPERLPFPSSPVGEGQDGGEPHNSLLSLPPTPLSQEEKESEDEASFLIRHERGTLNARQVIMATGGKSLPRTGSDGSGWEIIRRLGHTVTETYPALVPLVLRADFFHAELSGISVPVELTHRSTTRKFAVDPFRRQRSGSHGCKQALAHRASAGADRRTAVQFLPRTIVRASGKAAG